MQIALAAALAALAVAMPQAVEGPPATRTLTAAPDLAERTLGSMTTEEKVGQLIVAFPPGGDGPIDLGGVILLGKILRDPEAMRGRVQALQARSRIPLLIAVDLEGGELNRLRSVPTLGALPPARDLGAEGTWEAEAWGRRAGLDMMALGLNTSLGPVFDLADRGFMFDTKRAIGADPVRVARLGRAFARGLASAGVLAIGKHFPGYGPEAGSSDKALLIVDRPPQEIARQQAAFEAAGEALGGVMLANVGFAAYGGVPAILSPELVARAHLSGWLAVTDDLAVPSLLLATEGDPKELVRRAFLAGNDLLLTTAPVEWEKGVDPRAVLIELVRADPRLVPRLDESVLRILKAKVRHGLLREGVAAR
jgi:beta-N-acetylhexosaminidase